MNFYSARIATSTDLQMINECLRLSKGYWGYDKAFMQAIMSKYILDEEHLKQNAVKIFFYKDKMIGFYGFMYAENRIKELDYFFWHPSHIGMGNGRLLWQICISTAKEFG